jgi:hypothetical protein
LGIKWLKKDFKSSVKCADCGFGPNIGTMENIEENVPKEMNNL